MGLYLCVFENGKQLDGISVGSYGDFGAFRNAVSQRLEDGKPGTVYPTLILHSDCDGQWSHEECSLLEKELITIEDLFRWLPPVDFASGWQANVAAEFGLQPNSLYDSFIDIDGEPLIAGLLTLSRLAQNRKQPILFQ